MSEAKCRSLVPIFGVAFRAQRLDIRVSQQPLHLILLPQRKQEVGVSKEPAVFRRALAGRRAGTTHNWLRSPHRCRIGNMIIYVAATTVTIPENPARAG